MKTIADVVEAIIGVCYLNGGFQEAIKFCQQMEIEVQSPYYPSQDEIDLDVQTLKFLTERVSSLPDKIGYQFSNSLLLIQALTHPSIESLISYQRLEFLGDAVLDFIVCEYLFNDYNAKMSPGEMTKLKASLVCNENLSKICLEKVLYQHLIFNSECLQKEMQEYIRASTIIYKIPLNPPKVFSDIVEALAGAIFVDSGYDLNSVKKIFEPMVHASRQSATEENILSSDILNVSTALHPVSRLQEICQKFGLPMPVYEEKAWSSGGFLCSVQVNGPTIGSHHARSKKEGRYEAANMALQYIAKNPAFLR
jgi:endoribonuclease Dicer